MARSRYYHDPASKHLEVYQDFSLGLNSHNSSEVMDNRELMELVNFDLRARGVLRRAKGFKTYYTMNLAPNFDDERWEFHDNVEIISSRKITKTPNALGQNSYIYLEIDPSTEFTLSLKTDGAVYISEDNGEDYSLIGSINNTSYQDIQEGAITFTTTSGKIRIRLSAGTNVINQTKTFEDLMMTKGSEKVKYSQIREGKPQGFFRFYKSPTEYDEITVISGVFYINGEETPVGDGEAEIQTERPIEAVQFYDKMYIASGSGLIEYDGNTLNFVSPYRPKALEALYIGTNGLLPNPNEFMETTSGHTVLKVKGVTFSSRYVSQNDPVTIRGFAEKVNEDDELEWKFERRMPSHREGYYFVGRDWDVDNSYTFTTEWSGTMEIKVSVRKKGTEVAVDEFIVPHFTIKPTDDPEDEEISTASIDSCNRILVHWDRLILYGDEGQPDVIYISHLRNPAYFPVTNSQRFITENKEGITKIVRFRDNLVVFTPTTIQAFYGKAPIGDDPYFRVMLNSSIGCIAPETARVTGNHITFLSYEGVYRLKTLGYSENKVNVEPVDLQVRSDIPEDTNASAYIYDNDYCITFPSLKKHYRFNYERETWTSLAHDKLDYSLAYFYDGEVYLQGQNGRVVQVDEQDVLVEGTVAPATLKTKEFDFLEPYARKKVKELHLMVETDKPTTIKAEIFVDGKLNERRNIHEIEITPDQETYEVALAGRGYKTNVRLIHEDDAHIQVNGIGIVFKLKKP